MACHPVRSPARRAATLVETALVFSVALLLLFGVFEYARFLFVQHLVENAAREGARFAVVHTGDKTEADIKNQVNMHMAGMQVHLGNYNVTVGAIILRDGTPLNTSKGTPLAKWDDAKSTDGIVVEITADYEPVLPSLVSLPASLPLRARSVMYSEAN